MICLGLPLQKESAFFFSWAQMKIKFIAKRSQNPTFEQARRSNKQSIQTKGDKGLNNHLSIVNP
jgi:hypothetical protein